MSEKDRRRALTAEYRRTHPEAGVYRIVNAATGKALLSSALNLNSVRSKMEFARSTGTTGGLDHRLVADIRRLGIEAFALEILEVLDTRPEQTDAEIRADLAALEALWREKLDPATLY
jgi:hypothetical protein